MSAWDLTRRDVAKTSAPTMGPKLVGMESVPTNHLPSQHQAVSYWRDQLLALIENATRAGSQLPLNLDAANLVQSLPLLLLADKQQQQPLAHVGPQQTLIDSLASYCSRSLTPSPSTSSSHSNSAESGPELGLITKGPSHLPILIEASAPTADSTFCSSLSSYSSSGGSSCGDLSQATNDCTHLSSVQVPDRKARKKDQNRRAAFNYRRKKMEERDKMLEEEARLVHRHVRLAGKIARLEEKIVTMLNSRTSKIYDSGGKPGGHFCPACSKPCDTVAALRTHLKTRHFPEAVPQVERTKASTATSVGQAHARHDASRDCARNSTFKQAGCEAAGAKTDLETETSLEPHTHRDKPVDANCDSPDDVDDNEDKDDSDDDIDCDNNNDCNL